MLLKEGLIRGKFYWIFVILTVILGYGFTLTNYSMGVDDESFNGYFHEGGLLSQGRWGSSVTKYIFDTYEFLPFWRDFIAIVLITIGITLWGHIIKQNSENYFSEKSITIFACVAISCPFIVNNFIFMMTTVEMGLVLCLTAIAVNSITSHERNRYIRLLICVFSLVYAVSFSELAMVYFLLGIIIVSFLKTCFSTGEQEGKKFAVLLLNSFLLMFVVLLVNELIKYILQKIYVVPSSNYVSNMFLYNFSDFNNFFDSLTLFFKSFANFFLINVHPGVKITLFSSILILVFSIFISIKKRSALTIILGFGLVISAYSLFILTGNSNIPFRAMITNSIYVGFTVALIYSFLQRELNKFKIPKIALILICILVFYQTKYINEVFYIDYLRFQLDKTKADNIATDIMKESGKKSNKVVFIGQPDNYNLKIGDVEGYSVFQWDRFGGSDNEFKNNHRILSFINLQGYSIQSANDLNLTEVLTESANMPMYPSEGYIKNVGQYLIVKLGYTPQFSYISNKQLTKVKQTIENIKYSIDMFSYNNNNLEITGWGFLEEEMKGSEAISIALINEENKYSILTRVVPREDVFNAFPYLNKSNDVGFQLSFPTNLVKSGEYKVALLISNDTEQQMVYLNRDIIVK